MREIEADILSVCMLDSDNLNLAVQRGVVGDWFANDKHNRLFVELLSISQNKTWDSITCVNVIEACGIFERNPIALDISCHTPTWAFGIEQVSDAVDVLVSNYARRRSLTLLSVARDAIIDGDDPADTMSSLGGAIVSLESDTSESNEMTLEDIADKAFEIDKRISEGTLICLPFPWESLQAKTFGIPIPGVTPLAGRDGKGKSRLVRYLVHHWASLGYAGLYMPFEDGETRTVSGLAAINGKYDMFAIRRKFTPPDFLANHKYNLDLISRFPIKIIDCQSTVERIVTQISKAKRMHGIKFVVIDGFKDIIQSFGENQTRAESHIVATLVRASKKYDVAIIPISHLTKVDSDIWISKQNITGSGDQTKSARMVLVYQDSGFTSELKNRYHVETNWDRCNILQVQKASYGGEGYVILEDNYESSEFLEI